MTGGQAQPMRWQSGWYSLEAPQLIKRDFRVYLCVDCPRGASIRLTLETESRAKSKTVSFRPGARQRCVPFAVCGRRFRLTLESVGETPWQLLGGLQIDMDTEEDA